MSNSHGIANCNANGEECVTVQNYILRQKTILYREVYNRFLSKGQLAGAAGE